MHVGTLLIYTTLQEKLTAAVMRSSCPIEIKEMKRESFSDNLQGFFQIRDFFVGRLHHSKDRFGIERTFHDIFIKSMRAYSIIER